MGRVWIVALLHDVFDGDDANQVTVFVDERQLLNAVFLNNRLSLGQRCVFVAGH